MVVTPNALLCPLSFIAPHASHVHLHVPEIEDQPQWEQLFTTWAGEEDVREAFDQKRQFAAAMNVLGRVDHLGRAVHSLPAIGQSVGDAARGEGGEVVGEDGCRGVRGGAAALSDANSDALGGGALGSSASSSAALFGRGPRLSEDQLGAQIEALCTLWVLSDKVRLYGSQLV